MITDLTTIAQAAEKNEETNFRFKEFLRNYKGDQIDEMVFELNNAVSSQVDCTKCGNCCRSLMINVGEKDTERLSNHLNISKKEFEEKYIEKSASGNISVMKQIPCYFLHDNKCTVYEARPHECREFPGLHKAGFTGRLFATFMHYGRCPIIFNVIEKLKEKLNFPE